MLESKSISQFLADEYKEFSLYTIESRAIPSVIDGFKPTQRKIIHVSSGIWKTGSEKTLKVFQLAGKVASDAFYHHGNASLESSIITMAQKFKNNMPLLEEDGQFGSLRAPEPGAPRYIGTKLNKNFRLLYKDFELLKFKEEEGEVIEPRYFLPIIPTVLLNGSSGIAVGFSSNVLNRNPKDIIEACQNVLRDKKVGSIKPFIPDFKGTYIQDTDNPKRWIIRGIYEIVNTSTVKISELPPSMTYEKYEEILDELVEKKAIAGYDDNSKDKVDYTIKFNRESLAKYLEEDRLWKLLRLEEAETEIYTTLDEFGKLKIFDSPDQIVKYFVDFRLIYYHKRKKFMLDKLQHEVNVLSNRGKFIKAILDGKLEIKNRKKEELINDIASLELAKIDDSFDYLLRMPLWSLTKELFDKLREDFKIKKEEINELKATDPKDMYNLDLSELKKKVVG
jgi:DNA topoisomerase-2